MSRGGKREGAGRPKAEPTTVVRIRLTMPESLALMEAGGVQWIKNRIAELPQNFPKKLSEPRRD